MEKENWTEEEQRNRAPEAYYEAQIKELEQQLEQAHKANQDYRLYMGTALTNLKTQLNALAQSVLLMGVGGEKHD